MYRASSLINKHGMHILYYSLFMPYVMYYADVCYKCSLLSIITEKVMPLLCGAKRLDHAHLPFHSVHILKVPDLVKLKTATV